MRVPRSSARKHRRSLNRLATSGLAVCLGLGVLTGCTDERPFGDDDLPSGSWQLVAYDSCQDAINSLRAAAKSIVGPYGLWSSLPMPADGMAGAAAEPAEPPMARGESAMTDAGAAAEAAKAAPDFSGTNTHEAGVDEPDLVKTDGRRIVTLSGGTLRVTDAASRTVSSFIDLADAAGDVEFARYQPADLLLFGDHALVLMQQAYAIDTGVVVQDRIAGPGTMPVGAEPGPRLLLVDIAGRPRVLSQLTVDGGLVDARQVGSTARVVIRSAPRLEFPYPQQATDAERVEFNKGIIDRAEMTEWLPRIDVTTDGRTERTEIGCGDISRPEVYSGTSLLTILTVDLGGTSLNRTAPTVLVADGDTVYSNGPSLYVASDQRWRLAWMAGTDVAGEPVEPRTAVYKFDTSEPGQPTFVAGGVVPGHLLNQYSMSEWDGHLRLATTTESVGVVNPDLNPDRLAVSESGVHVLAHRGKSLIEVGSVTGLGQGERIHAVRFTGSVGYVVTFRQTDPLYTVDLRDPTGPVVRGELKIPGYSAYLHPVGPDRLIGIGQDATERGRVRGTQVSLFDVGDLTDPARLAQYSLPGAYSEAEFDPHAFLYWPAESLLVVPLHSTRPGVAQVGDSRVGMASTGALILRIADAGITEIGYLQHPASRYSGGMPAQIRRSLVIDQTLWTVSDGGLMANDIRTLARLAWIPFS